MTTEKFVKNISLDDVANKNIISLPIFPFFSRIQTFYEGMSVNSTDPISSAPEKKLRVKFLIKSALYYLLRAIKSRGCITGQRWPSYFHFWAKIGLRQLAQNHASFDVVISTYGPYHTHVLASKIKKQGSARYWVADYRDLWCLNPYFKGLPIINKFEAKWEKKIIRDADLVTTVSHGLKAELENFILNKRVEVIENGIDPDDFHSLDKMPYPFPKQATLQLAFTGSIYSHQEPLLLPLLKAVRQLIDEGRIGETDFHINIAGNIQPAIRQLFESFDLLPYTSFLGLLKHQNSLKLQRDANALIFLGHDLSGQEGNLTGKLGEYLFSKTPIWSFGVKTGSEVFSILGGIQYNKIFEKNDFDKLPDEIMNAIAIARKGRQLTDPPKIITDKFNRRVSSEKLLAIINTALPT